MNHEARCAFVYAQSVCAMAEIAAMQAHNQVCLSQNQNALYTYSDFMAVQNKYLVGHNSVIEYLREG